MNRNHKSRNALRAMGLALVPALFLVGTNARADETDYDNTAIRAAIGAAAGLATGNPVGVAAGAAAGAATGYVTDLKEGIADNERKYREGTEAFKKTQEDRRKRQKN